MTKNKKRRGRTKKERREIKRRKLRNKRLVKKYYWLAPKNVWTGQIPKDYDYHYIDWGWSEGWDRAFGWQYLKELGAAIEESGRKDFCILQIKEKYGQARCYTGATTPKVHNIIDKYEHISEHVCYYCGKEAPMVDDGWILPQCFKCYCRVYRRNEKWYHEYHPEKPFKTDEELREIYNSLIVDEPDENGEYHIPMSYTVNVYHGGEKEQKTYDISDTVKKIQKRVSKYA